MNVLWEVSERSVSSPWKDQELFLDAPIDLNSTRLYLGKIEGPLGRISSLSIVYQKISIYIYIFCNTGMG